MLQIRPAQPNSLEWLFMVRDPGVWVCVGPCGDHGAGGRGLPSGIPRQFHAALARRASSAPTSCGHPCWGSAHGHGEAS